MTTTKYAGNFIYKGSNGNTETLEFFNHPEGYIEPHGNGFRYVYQYKDHLGNIRISYSDYNGDGNVDIMRNGNDIDGDMDNQNDIIEESNYYPFGLKHEGYNTNVQGEEHAYKTFQGQEISKEMGYNMFEFKFRHYDPAIARFVAIDPLAENFVNNSVYAFSENRVIDGWELEGKERRDVHSEDPNLQDLSPEQKQTFNNGLRNGTSTGVDFLPVVGDAKGFIEAFTGEDLITGHQLNAFSRILGILMLSELRVFDKIGDAYRGLKVLGEGSMSAFESATVTAMKERGDQIIAAGDSFSGTGKTLSAQSLGIGGDKAADILSVSASGKFNITEVKGVISGNISAGQVDGALGQIGNTVSALKSQVNGAKIGSLELAVPKGTTFGGVYGVSGNQLVRNTDAGQQVVRVQGQVVNVRQID